MHPSSSPPRPPSYINCLSRRTSKGLIADEPGVGSGGNEKVTVGGLGVAKRKKGSSLRRGAPAPLENNSPSPNKNINAITGYCCLERGTKGVR